ncbi:Uncharacterised protein [Streptococcus pneumoniae]|nr:Uncharacterised protein [Streptococcus pneumoniae]
MDIQKMYTAVDVHVNAASLWRHCCSNNDVTRKWLFKKERVQSI